MNELTVPRPDKNYAARRRARLHALPEPERALPRTLSGVAWARAYRTRLRVTDTLIVFVAVGLGYLERLMFQPALFSENGSLLRFGLGSIVVIILWAAASRIVVG